MKYRPTIAEPGAPLSASALNELSAEIRRLGGGTIVGGTQDGTNFNPDQSKGFYAKITSVGTGGWHSWQMVKWNSATAAWIDPPAPAAKGHKDTNGAFDPNGNSSAVNDIVWLEPLGVRKVSTKYWPAYAIKAGAGSSGGGANAIGETCQGYYNGGSRVTTGGAFGYGYNEASVPVGASTTPYSTLETWRLHHGAELNTTNGCWAAGVYPTFGSPSSYAIPTIDTTAYRLRFSGKRGDLVSGTTYNCYQYKLDSLTVSGKVQFYNGSPLPYFQFTNKSGVAYSERFLDTSYMPSAGQPGFYGAEMFGYVVGWKALANGANSWAIMYPNLFRRIDSNIAWIGFTHDTGWFIQTVSNRVYNLPSSQAGPIGQAQT